MIASRSAAPANAIIRVMPGFHTGACYAFLPGGSCLDPVGYSGLGHLLEHLLTRSTQHRPDPAELRAALSRLGAELIAGTTRDFIFIGLRGDAGQIPAMSHLLAEMVLTPLLSAENLRIERRIIREELATAVSDPLARARELLSRQLWGVDHPMSRPVGGTLDGLARIRLQHVVDHHRALTRPGRLLLSVAGGIAPEEREAILAPWAESLSLTMETSLFPLPDAASTAQEHPESVVVEERNDVPVCLLVGWKVQAWHTIGRIPFVALSNILAGGDDSRLFTQLHQERALLYEVSAKASFFRAGLEFVIQLVCTPSRLRQVVPVVCAAIEEMREVQEDELLSFRRQFRTTILMEMDDPNLTAYRTGRFWMAGLGLVDEDALLDQIASVSVESVRKAADALLRSGPPAVVVVGPRLTRGQKAVLERLAIWHLSGG